MKKSFLLIICATIFLRGYSKDADSLRFPIINESTPGIEKVVNYEGKLDDKFQLAIRYLSSNKSQFIYSNGEKGQALEAFAGVERRRDATSLNDKLNDNVGVRIKNDQDHTILSGISIRFSGGSMGHIGIMAITCDVDITFKEGRYKIKISNFNYTDYNSGNGRPQQLYGWKDEGPCKSTGNFSDLIQCKPDSKQLDGFFEYVNKTCEKFISDFQAKLNSTTDDNNW